MDRVAKRILSLIMFTALIYLIAASSPLSQVWALQFDAPPAIDSSDATGVVSVVVVPVKFRDRENSTSVTDLDRKVFTELNGYFQEASYGKLTLTGTVLPKWYKLTRAESWYGRGYEQWEILVLDALSAAKRDVDYLEYDYAMIVHAGDDESRSLNSSEITSFGTLGKTAVTVHQRRYILGISCLSELDPIGPYAHFLALNMGLPSMNKGWERVGEWDLLAHGFWALNGTMPVHPTSWSKLKAKWLKADSIVTVDPGEGGELDLASVALMGGVKASKIPVTDKQYFLVEARTKTGFDQSLPGEGVLILYVDEAKLLKQAALQVVDTRPETETLDDAALQVGEIYANATAGFTVAVLSQNASTFRILIDRTGESAPAKIAVEAMQNVTVKIDELPYVAGAEGLVERDVLFGPHLVEVPPEIEVSNRTKNVFKRWSDGISEPKRSLNVSSDTMVQAQYLAQHLLEVSSPYGNPSGAGWYDEGATATVQVEDLIEYPNGTRRVFESWDAGGTFTRPTIELVMDGPKAATSRWKTEYKVEFTATGLPEGTPVTLTLNGDTTQVNTPFTHSAWYRRVEQLTFHIAAETPDEQQTTFVGFTDSAGNPLTAPLVVDKPTTVNAVFRTAPPREDEKEEPSTPASSPLPALFEKAYSRVISSATSNPYLLHAFLVVGSPTYWCYLIADTARANIRQPFLSQMTFALAFGSLIGLFYLFPLSLLILAVAAWRLRHRPRLKPLLLAVVILVVGIATALCGLFLSASISATVVIIGLAVAALGAGLLTALALSTAIVGLLASIRAPRLRWK